MRAISAGREPHDEDARDEGQPSHLDPTLKKSKAIGTAD
jgi:hypothetical protein